MSKKTVLTIILIFGLASISPAQATRETHGGGAIRCQTKDGATVELLDLYEAKSRGLTIPLSNDSVSEQIDRALARLELLGYPKIFKGSKGTLVSIGEAVKDELSSLPQVNLWRKGLLRFNPGPFFTAVIGPPDTGLLILPEGCTLLSAGLYESRRGVLFLTSVYRRMGPTAKAALLVHEGLYKVFRDASLARNSESTRKLVGTVFSTQSLSGNWVFSEANPQDRLYPCKRVDQLEQKLNLMGRAKPTIAEDLALGAMQVYTDPIDAYESNAIFGQSMCRFRALGSLRDFKISMDSQGELKVQ